MSEQWWVLWNGQFVCICWPCVWSRLFFSLQANPLFSNPSLFLIHPHFFSSTPINHWQLRKQIVSPSARLTTASPEWIKIAWCSLTFDDLSSDFGEANKTALPTVSTSTTSSLSSLIRSSQSLNSLYFVHSQLFVPFRHTTRTYKTSNADSRDSSILPVTRHPDCACIISAELATTRFNSSTFS